MKKKRAFPRFAPLLLVLVTAVVITAVAAGSPGSEGDPLVTLSYLNDTFMSQMLSKVDEKLSARDRELSDKLDAQVKQDTQALAEKYGTGNAGSGESGTAETFTVVTLSSGQTLYGEIGCEVMLRVGTASCVAASAPGLIDETDASTLNGGAALVKNHLYMMTISDRGVRATAETSKLLVRGAYSIR